MTPASLPTRPPTPSSPRPIVILGPTAGGKSELAVLLAEALGGQVINADSMQVYRHLDAGTAKPTADQRRRAVHHLIDIIEPSERFTVADWLARADPLIEQLRAQGVRPIVVGGTNLYLKALLEGMFAGPPIDRALRHALAQQSAQELHAELARIDPVAAGRIHPNDHKRITRAIEVHRLTGKPISQWQQQWDEVRPEREAAGLPPREHPAATGYRHDPMLVGLDWPTDAINRRINARVKAMFFPTDGSESLPDEVRRLERDNLLGPPDAQARQALGYKQVLEHLAGKGSLDDAFEQTKIQTRRFAKTQRNWLKRYRHVHWLDADTLEPPALRDAVLGYLPR